jgi:hypothetical protein
VKINCSSPSKINGVTFNDITKDAAIYTSTSRFVAWLGAFYRERQSLWLPKDNLKDSSTWSSPPLVLLCDIHDSLLDKYHSKDSVTPPAQPGARPRPARDSQDDQDGLDGASQQETVPLFLPQLNQIHEFSFVRGEDTSNVVVIPTQDRVTQQILSRWQPFKDLKLTFTVSLRSEQLCLHVQQRVIATVEDSALCTEMENLESDEEDASRRVLWYKPMSWLGQIRLHRRDPNDIDRSLNESTTDKIRKYRADYNNNQPSSVAFMPIIVSTSGRLHSEFVRLLFLQDHRETDRFFTTSGVSDNAIHQWVVPL